MSSFVKMTLLVGAGIPLPVPKEVIDALESVNVTSATSTASGFQLTFRLTRRSPLHTLFLLATGGGIPPLLRVIIAVTVMGDFAVLMDGVVTETRVAPGSEPGTSTLTVRGEDLSATMKYIELNGVPYPGMPAQARVALMLAKYAVFGVVPMALPEIMTEVDIPTEKIPTQRGTDFDYIKILADEAGYVFYVDPGPVPGASVAYWGPEVRLGYPQPALSTNLDAHTNVESMSFDYNAERTKLPLVYVQIPSVNLSVPIPIPNVSVLKPPLAAVPAIPRRVTKVRGGAAKRSPLRAALMGVAEAADSQDAVTGTGSLDVRRYGRVLKARGLVGVRGAGAAFDGLYYVDEVSHQIEAGSYKQNFRLKRDGLLSNTPRVPV